MGYILISHALCPYVQRVDIALREKGLAFERSDIDLADKPGWFLRLSPLGKTPVLVAGDEALFESAIICDYLDEMHTPRLHPGHPLGRARHRAWGEYASAVLAAIGAFYSAPDAPALARRADELRAMFATLEGEVGRHAGPWFAGVHFSLVDAAFAPAFRYFDTFETLLGRDPAFDFFGDVPRVRAWRSQLAARPSVRAAVGADYPARLRQFIAGRASALARRAAP